MVAIPASDISDGVRGLAEDLSADMPRIVLRPHRATLKTVNRLIRAGDFNAAQDVVRGIDFGAAKETAQKRIRRTTRSSMLIGSGAVGKPSESLIAQGAPVPWEVDVGAVRLIHNMTTRQLNTVTRRAFLDRILAASRFQKAASRFQKAAGDPIDPDKLASDINRYLRGEIKRVVDVSGNLVGTRVASYGMLYEARAQGVSQYRIDAILDTRTTDICRGMDGKVFEVEKAFERVGELLGVEDPETVKSMSPFPPQDQEAILDLMKLDASELQNMGFDTPPFHFLCRSVVTLIDASVEYNPVSWTQFPDLSDALLEIRHTAPKYNRVAGKLWGETNPYTLFDAASKATPDDMQLYAPSAYTGVAFSAINYGLRRNRPLSSDMQEITLELDTLVDGSVAPDVTYSYRGIKQAEADKMEMGKVFQDDAFVSTSLDPEVALDFTSSTSKTVLQIQTGTGQKILPIYATSTVPAEWEMLLPRGAQMRVIGSAEQTVQGQRVKVIRVVYQGVGDTLPVDQLGLTELPTPVSVVKAVDRFDRFTYEADDLREASFLGG